MNLSIGRLHHPHSLNISEIARSIQIQFHIKPQAFGEQIFVKMIQSGHAMPVYIVVSTCRGGQGAISPPKSMNGTRGLDDAQH